MNRDRIPQGQRDAALGIGESRPPAEPEVDRCEACGSDRGDGYCQECPDDPDRPRD